MVVYINIKMFWDVMPWGLRVIINVSEKPAASISQKENGNSNSQTAGTYPSDYVGLHPRTLYRNIKGLPKTRITSYFFMLISKKQQMFYFTCS
jgi:hypothetical protein